MKMMIFPDTVGEPAAEAPDRDSTAVATDGEKEEVFDTPSKELEIEVIKSMQEI